ncbi:MAG: TRAP transporter small permease subunit [Bacteroidia bacterium]|nr:TRAP transporter small permease subunit [Bacteroidia bacterium]
MIWYHYLPRRLQYALPYIVSLSTILLFGIMLVVSVQMVRLGMEEISPSLHLPMALAFVSMGVLSLGMVFYSILHLIKIKK